MREWREPCSASPSSCFAVPVEQVRISEYLPPAPATPQPLHQPMTPRARVAGPGSAASAESPARLASAWPVKHLRPWLQEQLLAGPQDRQRLRSGLREQFCTKLFREHQRARRSPQASWGHVRPLFRYATFADLLLGHHGRLGPWSEYTILHIRPQGFTDLMPSD